MMNPTIQSTRRRVAALSMALFLTGIASTVTAQEEKLQNDGWVDNTAAGFQGGFVSGEIGAAVFVPDAEDYPVRLKRVQFLFGGADEGSMREVGIRVWQDVGTDAPGALVYEDTYQFQSSTSAFTEIDLSAANLMFSGRFRVGLVFMHSGFPGIARDNDPGNDFLDRNFIFAQDFGWVPAWLLGVDGDWIIRAVVDVGGSTGCNDDAGCGTGEICRAGACTSGCRTDGACASNQICQVDTCITGCRADTSCGAGSICEGNACIAGCRDDDACGAGEICEARSCASGCRDDVACGAGEICEDQACIAGCRDDAGCEAGSICEDAACVLGCRDDGACGEGEVCNDATCEVGCRDDAGCEAGEVCDEGQCITPPGCIRDADCAGTAICILRTGECMEVECLDASDCLEGEVCTAAFVCEVAANNNPGNNNPGNNNPNNPGNNNPGNNNPAPGTLAVTSITPSSAPNDRATQVTLVGSGFSAETTFRVGPTRLTEVTIQNETVALATVPAGITPGVYDVVVSRGAEQYAFTQGFIVESALKTTSGGSRDDGCQTAPGRTSSLLTSLLVLGGLLLLRRR